jgi:FkbM family methyltransferase
MVKAVAHEFSILNSLTRIRDLGQIPKTIFDLGVATGTEGLYDVFPDARYVLIDPLDEAAPFMRALVEKHPGSIAVNAAAGREVGTAQFVVSAALSGSSFLLSPESGEMRAVPVVTIDGVAEAHGLEPPYVIKLDIQGYELEALAGAEKTLKDTIAVIAETSLWADRKGKGMPTILELMTWMRERGFVLYDIANLARRKLDDAITEMDLVFCPAASPMRAIKSYKSPEHNERLVEERRRSFGLPPTPAPATES